MIIKKHQGFSLVEAIVALTILSTVAAAIYLTFSQGIRLWNRLTQDGPEWKSNVFLEKLTDELRNTYTDPQWIFRGTSRDIVFSSLRPGTGKDASRETIKYFQYTFDKKNKVIYNLQLNFEDVFSLKPSRFFPIPVLKDVNLFRLEYYTYDKKTKKYYWSTTWHQDCLPETIRVTVEMESPQCNKVVRMIHMPIGGVCPS